MLVTGFSSLAPASSSLLDNFFEEMGVQQQNKNTSPELGPSQAHTAWVDLGTQATEHVLTAAGITNNEGLSNSYALKRAINAQRETDAKSSLTDRCWRKEVGRKRNGNLWQEEICKE